jgi:nucleoside-diphosphate-sugar epimerase
MPDVYNCAGITDPSIDQNEINLVNFELPIFLSEQSNKLDFRLVSFGTVMELLPKYSVSNRYLESKLRFYKRLISDVNWLNRNIHIQLHTLYGGSQIHRHMFLGQIFHSISSKEMFNMSGGEQIREYHHIEDDAQAIKQLTSKTGGKLIDISHGQPERLKDIAIFLFNHFNSRELLNISTRIADKNDNRTFTFKKTDDLSDSLFRPTLSNLILWLERLGVSDEQRQ